MGVGGGRVHLGIQGPPGAGGSHSHCQELPRPGLLAGSMEAVTRPDLDDSGRSEHATTAGGNSGKAWQQVRRQRLERGVELDWLHPGTFQGLTPLGIDGFLKTD